jgi:hypothetical protein
VFQNTITGIRMRLCKNPVMLVELGSRGNISQGSISLHSIVILIWVSYLQSALHI